MDLTWQEVRDVRDQELHDTDAKVGQTDAPDAIQQGWLSYRQKLRDPTMLWNSKRIRTFEAVMMFPVMPKIRDPDAPRSQIPEMVLLQLMYKLLHKKPR